MPSLNCVSAHSLLWKGKTQSRRICCYAMMTNSLREQGERQVAPPLSTQRKRKQQLRRLKTEGEWNWIKALVKWRKADQQLWAGMTPCELWGPDGPKHKVKSTVRGWPLLQRRSRSRTCAQVNACVIIGLLWRHCFSWPLLLASLLLLAGTLHNCQHRNAKHVTGWSHVAIYLFILNIINLKTNISMLQGNSA